MFSRTKLFCTFNIRRLFEKTEPLGYPARKWQCVFPTLAPRTAINVAKLYLGVIQMELVFQECRIKGFRVMDVYSKFQTDTEVRQ